MNVCPVCRGKVIIAHCSATKDKNQRHPTCHWLRCTLCGAILDPQNRRGVDHKLRPFRIIEGSR